jgi:cytochrome c-type biogenesis protein CcmH
LYAALLVALALVALTTGTSWAQTNPPAGVSSDAVNDVARELWCPLCNGVRLDSCELKACDQMKEVIALKLAEGEDTQTIKNYFVEQYGPQVLGEPPRSGFNWLAWILPFAAALGGGLFVWLRARSMVRPAYPNPEAAAAEQDAPPAFADTAASRTPEEEEYARKLDEELAKYG